MKKSGITLAVLGVLLLAGTVIWMTVGLNVLLVIPDGQDMTAYYEGEATFYVNPITQEPLPAGQEMVLPLEISRRVFTVDAETTSDRIVFQEEISASFGLQKSERTSVYVLDRKESVNVADDRAYDWMESNKVDRSGTYTPLFPMDTSPDGTYYVWKAESQVPAVATFLEEKDEEGVHLIVFGGPIAREKVVPAYLEVMGFPESVPFSTVAGQLKAAGFDVDGFLAQGVPRMAPEDQQAVAQVTQSMIPLTYYWDADQTVGIEAYTGLPADIMATTEIMSMSPDLTVLLPLFNAILKYSSDPVLGPYVQKLVSLQSTLTNAEPGKVFMLDYSSTDESVAEMADAARDNITKIKIAKTYLPIGGFALGGLLLVIGLALIFVKKKGAAA